MIDSKLYQQINKIREKSNKNKLIVFVGSGVSRNVEGMPSWSYIVKCMAEELHYERCKKCRHRTDKCQEECGFKDEYSTDELLKIPQYLYNTDKEAYSTILSKEVRDVDCDAPLSHLIFDLNPKHIITTNYDRLLERSQHVLANQYQVIVENKDLLGSDNNKYIVKMHGCIQNPHTIVLKEDDYLDYSRKHILIETFLKSLIVDNTILFLGYSINDYNVKLILSWLNYFKNNKSSLPQNKNIGYIVLDDENLDDVDKEYFKHNNIEVINTYKIKPVENIPASISADIGKRLFTFLKIISNPHMDVLFDKDIWLSRIIANLDDSIYINYQDLLKILYLDKVNGSNSSYKPVKKEETLIIYQKEIYDILIDITSNSKYSKKVKQLFINSGISVFQYENLHPSKGKLPERVEFEIDNAVEDKLSTRQLFKDWYVCNYHVQESKNEDKNEYYFYRHLVYGYDEVLLRYFYNAEISQENGDLYVRYLFNKKALDNVVRYIFKNDELRNYINNTSNELDGIRYRHYSDILNGNREKRFLMNERLNKVKQCAQCDFENLYELKNYAIDEFKFYFYNNLFFSRFTDLGNILKIYIEALIYSNREFKASSFFDFPYSGQKYVLDSMDIIILTAFIEPKALHSIINESGIKRLNINNNEKSLIIKSLANNSMFFKTNKAWYYDSLAERRLINLFQILPLIDFIEEEKKELSNIISQLLSNKTFINYHFTIHCTDFRLILKILINAIDIIDINNGLEIVKKIISTEAFFEYYANIGAHFSAFIRLLLKKHYRTQKSICDFIDECEEESKKIKLLLMFIGVITNKTLKLKYKQFLMENIKKISENTLVLFAIHDWIDVPIELVEVYFSDIIKLDQVKSNVKTYPDPYERKIDAICLLFLMGKISELSKLKNLSKKPSYLEFLIDQDNFDYTKVDFEHYMWGNIIRNDEYRKLLIDNKKAFVEKLKDKHLTKTITEVEKKILYKYFLDDNELWKI